MTEQNRLLLFSQRLLGAIPVDPSHFQFVRSRIFLSALAVGPIGWLFILFMHDSLYAAPSLRQTVLFVIAYPIVEEVVFRGLLYEAFGKALTRITIASISLTNLCVSSIFTALHLLQHNDWLVIAVFIPSLLFGILRERFGALLPSICLHAYYNAGLLSIIAAIYASR